MVGELAALGASVVWALASLIFAKLGKQRLSPLAMNLLKCSMALGLMCLTLLLMQGRAWPAQASATQVMFLAISGLIGLALGDTCYFNALSRIGARRTLLLSTMGPPTTAILAWPLLGEPLTLGMGLGMGLTILGVVWVIRERSSSPGRDEDALDAQTLKLGLGFALISVVCQAAGNVLTKLGAEGAPMTGLELGMVRLGAGICGLIVVVTLRRRLSEVLAPLRSARQFGALAVATVLGTYLGIWLLMTGLSLASKVGVAATLSSLSPIFVMIFSALFLKERLSARTIFGTLIAVLGVALLFAFK